MSRSILVYGDMNLNFIDGSAIWLQSVVTMLAKDPGNEVTVLLKAHETRDLLTAPLRALRRVKVETPGSELVSPEWGMTPNEALDRLEQLDGPHRFVVLRGFDLVQRAAARGSFDGRLCPYLTDIPQSPSAMTPARVRALAAIARASKLLLCQTEELRAHLEGHVPEARGKAILLTPMVPDRPPQDGPTEDSERRGPLRLVYAGKFAPDWNTLEMAELLGPLRERCPGTQLHMLGDKIHEVRDDPGWAERMRAALGGTEGLVWHGALPREQVLAVIADADVALSWRSPALDESLELSTKLLEYGQAGLPVLLNRTPMHERLLGADYPLFANDPNEALDALAGASERGEAFRLAALRCARLAEDFTMDRAYARIAPYLERAAPKPRRRLERTLRVVAAGHDWKFFHRIVEHLEALPGVELRRDEWEALTAHDERRSAELAAWADVIVCEWCGGAALFYARHKRPGQRLYVRLHRFELYASFPKDLDIRAVDRVIVVSEHYRRLAMKETGWKAEKLLVVPNYVDHLAFDRRKRFGARFHLGMLGIVPSRKRFDRALDILRRLRRLDDRYMLFVKSQMPWTYPAWHRRAAIERPHYLAAFTAMNEDSDLRAAVVFDAFGADVPAWMTKIGFVLSPSDDESFHLAPAEGMASGAVPMLLSWPGAEHIYDPRWIHADEAAVADHIHALNDTPGAWEAAAEQARAQVADRFSVERVTGAFEALVLGDEA